MDLTKLFGEETLIQQVNNADVVLAAGAYPASGSYIDTMGLFRFAFLILPGTTAAQQTWQVQQATAVDGVLKDITGAVVTILAGDDGKPHLIEVATDRLDVNNGYRYVTLLNTGGGAGDYAGIVFLGWGKKIPVTQVGFGDFVAVAG